MSHLQMYCTINKKTGMLLGVGGVMSHLQMYCTIKIRGGQGCGVTPSNVFGARKSAEMSNVQNCSV